PGELAVGDASRGELEDEERVVFALGLRVVDEARTPGQDLDDLVLLPERVAGHLDGVAAQVVERAPSRAADVPEVRAVGTAVGLARAYPEHAADAALLDDV